MADYCPGCGQAWPFIEVKAGDVYRYTCCGYTVDNIEEKPQCVQAENPLGLDRANVVNETGC
jgi:hypothetical protein